MSHNPATDSLEDQYKSIVKGIDEVFTSYKTLYDVYSTSFATIKSNLDGLPAAYLKKVENAKRALEHCENSVEERQKEISSQVYGQRLVLIVGASESLLREAFRSLVINNLGVVNIKDNVAFSFEEVRSLIATRELGEALLDRLEDEKNPTDKLNFQNVKQLAGILRGYFDIDLKGDYLTSLHKFWQIRHIIIHNSGKIDKRFLDNLKAASISVRGYKLGEVVAITRTEYNDCNQAFIDLFKAIDKEIERLKLNI